MTELKKPETPTQKHFVKIYYDNQLSKPNVEKISELLGYKPNVVRALISQYRKKGLIK